MKKNDIRKISVVAMLTATAFLCTLVFRFKVGFLTFDFKDAIISIISLLYGPLWGVGSAGTVALFEMISASDTGPYGMIMNFISSGTFALMTGLVYKYNRTFKGAIISVTSAVFGVVSVMMLANILITPHYMGVTTADVIALIPTMLLPFNCAKAILNSAVVLVIYKPLTNILRKIGLIEKDTGSRVLRLKSVILLIVSIIIIILTVLFIILIMNGQFEVFRIN